VVFDLFHVTGTAIPSEPGDQWPAVPPAGTYVRNTTTGNLEVYSGTTLIGEYLLSAASPSSVTTGPNGIAKAADLGQGFYLVIENVAASTSITNANTGEELFISQAAAPFVVAVPMTNPAGDGWLDEVHVYPKNEALTVEKEVASKGAVAVGDTVSYTITVSIPGDISDSKKFIISDTLDAALDLDESSVVVSTLPILSGADALVAGTDYVIAYDVPTRTLSVTFQTSGREKLEKATSVSVDFDATVNASILTSSDLTVPNTANVDFTNSQGTDYYAESDGKGANIHTAAISITKIDETAQALNGAKFKIATSEENARAGYFLRIDSDSVLYDYPAATWTALDAANDYEISPTNVAAFAGLRDFIVDASDDQIWQTYWVVETVAPAGYNLLTAPIEVSFESAYLELNDPEDYDHMYLLTVKNSKGFTLPETGGMGTILWTVAGVALLGVAVLIGVTRRRGDAETH
ncbi:MAG: SpaH/EbpB family LPXTG-anchored major pilin, partial [Propionibacteriaceae bacterium]|nr:SpaH/EbpB family LPXTG-anchored major pilin [Propionibacteriaceae bacterium]